MIYFIQEVDPPYRIKIGFSKNAHRRISVLAATLPQNVQILKIVEGERLDEQWLHYRWREYRVFGKREWYYPCAELLDEINAPNAKIS